MNRDMGKPKTKTTPLPVRLRRVLDEAEDLFLQEGFLHFSTGELARRLRCSKRTIYAIAPGREKFFEAVTFQKIRKTEEATIKAIRNASNVRAAIEGCLQATVEQVKDAGLLWVRDLRLFPAGRRAMDKWRANIADELEHLIERGTSEGLIRRIDPRVAAEALLTSVMRMSDPDFSAKSRTTTADAIRQVYEIFWAGLCREPRDAYSVGRFEKSAQLPTVAVRPER